jgi:NADH dehydrogenase
MRIAITGGSGFVGSHLAARLSAEGHQVVAIARGVRPHGAGVDFRAAATTDEDALAAAFANCDAVAHCAGINREIGEQTFQRVHVDGTRAVVAAAKRAGVRKIIFLSFLRARPDCGSPYHESKWAAEEIVRASGIGHTIIKAGMIYGRGDHMLDHLSHAIQTLPIFATIGIHEKAIRPLAIDDLMTIMAAAIDEDRLSPRTFAVTGPEELRLSDAVRRVAGVLGRRVFVIPLPIAIQYLLAHAFELTMKVPLVAVAQVRILSEGIVEPLPFGEPVPADLAPRRSFTDDQIRAGLPERGRFTLRDLRCCRA